jgi:nucleoporin p58/p45
MLDFRENIREYRDDSERLDQCSHFDDLSPFNFEFDAGQIIQVGFTTFVSSILNKLFV